MTEDLVLRVLRVESNKIFVSFGTEEPSTFSCSLTSDNLRSILSEHKGTISLPESAREAVLRLSKNKSTLFSKRI